MEKGAARPNARPPGGKTPHAEASRVGCLWVLPLDKCLQRVFPDDSCGIVTVS